MEKRDIGPYLDGAQVRQQWDSWVRGMPVPEHQAIEMLIREALMIAGVQPSEHELQVLGSTGLHPAFAQVLAGWLIRARIQAK